MGYGATQYSRPLDYRYIAVETELGTGIYGSRTVVHIPVL